MAERLVFDLFAIDHASKGFLGAAKSAQVATGQVKELARRLDEVGTRSAKATVGLKGNQTALLQIEQLQLKLLKLGDKVHPDISLEGFARASAEISALELQMGRLSRKMSGPGGVSSAAFTAVNALGGLAGAGTTLINPVTIAAAALAAIMAGPLIAALLPITLGFGLFAAAGAGALAKVTAAQQKLTTAQAQYAKATTPAGRAAALKAEAAATAGLTGQQKTLLGQLPLLSKAFGALQKAAAPYVIKAVSIGLGIIRTLMPALTPLVRAAGQAFDAFLGNIAAWLKSPSGKKFLRWLATEGPHDIKLFGQVLWDFARITGQVFTFLRNAGNTWWKNVTHIIHDVDRLVTVVAPAAFDIFKESVRITWDQVKIAFLEGALSITTTMGHLPGPLGAPFRKASADIRKELGKIQADVANAANNIQADWDRLHGKTVTVQFDLSTGVRPPGAPHAAAGGVSGAAPGWWWVGEQGPELAYFRGGETVIPHGQSMRIAGGYAGGTGFDFRDVFRPSVSRFGPQLSSAFTRAENQVIAANRTAMLAKLIAGLSPPGPSGGAPAALEQFAASLFRGYGWGPDQLPPLVSLWNRESGWNRFARNPSSGAYGIAQALPPTKYPFAGQAAGGSSAAAQIGWGESYIKGRYGSPFAAWVHETMFNWYDHGGPITETILGVGRSGKRYGFRAGEHVTPRGGQQVVLQLTGSAPRNEADAFLVSWLKRLIASGHLSVQTAP